MRTFALEEGLDGFAEVAIIHSSLYVLKPALLFPAILLEIFAILL